MKRKLLLAALCVVGALGMRAQTDVTSTYIGNAGFEGSSPTTIKTNSNRYIYQPEEWIATYINGDNQWDSSGFTQNQDGINYGFSAYDGVRAYLVRFHNQKNSQQITLSQKKTLPKGKYTLSGWFRTQNQNELEVGFYYDEYNTTNRIKYESGNGSWRKLSNTFTQSSTGEKTIGVFFKHTSGNTMVAGVDSITLIYENINVDKLHGLIAYATQINATKHSSSLATAISAAEGVYAGVNHTTEYQTTIDNAISALTEVLQSTLESLTDGDASYLVMNPSFEDGQTQYGKTKGGDAYYAMNWTSAAFSSDSYSYSTVSNEYNSKDGNSFKIRFNWTNSTYTISQEVPVALPAGRYKLTADVRATSVNGSTEYAYIQGNNTSGEKIIVSTSDFSTVSATVDLNETGTLTITLGMDYRFDTRNNTNQSAEGIYYWDNVTLSYLSPLSASKEKLLVTLNNAADIIDTSINVGTAAFQIPIAAKNTLAEAKTTAQGVYDNSNNIEEIDGAKATLEAAINTYNTAELNAPVEGVQYRIKSTAASGADWKDKYYLLKKNPAQQNGGYSISAEATDAAHYATAWVFNPTGDTNQYTISMTDEDGATRYICTNIKGYDSGSATQIRTTKDATKALVVKVIASPDTEGRWNLQNTEDNSYIGGQDAGLYSNSQYYDLAIEAATKASVNINIKAGKWGTCIFPFVPTLPEGVEAYTYTSVVNNDVLDLTKVDEPTANVPYILKNTTEELVNKTVQGYGTAKQDSYSGEALVGYYTSGYNIPGSSYVLQTQGGVQAFYLVSSTMTGKGVANRCYLTLPANANKRNALFFDKEEGTTGLEAPAATSTDDGILYNVAGQQVNASYKGLIIKNRRVMLNK